MRILIFFLWVVFAVILQVLLFNHLSLAGGLVLLYVVALLKVPSELNRSLQILLGFVVGLVVDIFCNTLGMHTFAAVTTMFLREPVLHLYFNDPEFKNESVSANRVGAWTFVRYVLSVLIMHTVLLYGVESFTLFNFSVLLLKIFISTLLTLAVAVAIELASLKK